MVESHFSASPEGKRHIKIEEYYNASMHKYYQEEVDEEEEIRDIDPWL